MIKTIASLPPPIQQCFNKDLLLFGKLQYFLHIIENQINALAKRKIRIQDTGKKRDFEKLLKEFEMTYERKKIEKEEYDEKIKNSAKRPRLPFEGKSIRFKGMESSK